MPDAWPYWIDHTGNVVMGCTATTSTNVWLDWTSATATTASNVIDPWPYWTTMSANVYMPGAAPIELTPKQRQARARQALVLRNRHRASNLRRKIAERTAERLLLEHLTEEQQREWQAEKAFHVETAGGGRRYRIKRGLAGNVTLVRDATRELGGRQPRYCMHVYHPDGWVPHEDNVLAQKLLLETDEAEFLRLANVS